MPNLNLKRVLVAVDHSGQSMEAADYISGIMDPESSEVVLFNIETDYFDIFFDCDDSAADSFQNDKNTEQLIEIRNRTMDSNMEKAAAGFIKKGFPKERISRIIRPLEKGVARDILSESFNGYDLLVIGKSGMNRIYKNITGTVTAKLLSRVFHIPLVIISGRPETSGALLGYDGSEGAGKAVETAASLLRNDLKEIVICHVIRGFTPAMYRSSPAYTSFYRSCIPELEGALLHLRRKKLNPLMKKACNCFTEKGFPGSAVHTAYKHQMASRSKALLDTCRSGGYGTLILGRKGNSAVKEFFMGRVGKKAVDQAESTAVWII